MKQAPKKHAEKPRNLLHDHPLLRKSGAHGKTGKAQRRKEQVALKKEWCPHSAFVESALPTPLAA